MSRNLPPIFSSMSFMFSSFTCCYSVARLHPTLCDPMVCSTPGFPVLHQLPELAQTHVHWINDAIQPSCPLSSIPSPPAFSLSHHQGLFQWVGCLHQVAKVLEVKVQYQSFPWIFRAFIHAVCWSLCIRQLLEVRAIGKWTRCCLCCQNLESSSELTLLCLRAVSLWIEDIKYTVL